MSAFLAFCVGLVGVVYVFSFVGKIRRPGSWAELSRVVHTVFSLPRPLSSITVGLLILAEGVSGAAIVVTPLRPVMAILSLALFVGVIVTVGRRQHATCNCFGAEGGPISMFHVVRNGILFVLSLFAMLGPSSLGPVEIVSLTVGGIASLLFVYGEDLFL